MVSVTATMWSESKQNKKQWCGLFILSFIPLKFRPPVIIVVYIPLFGEFFPSDVASGGTEELPLVIPDLYIA